MQVCRALSSSRDAAALVVFRIAFGAIMLWEVWRYFRIDRIARYYIEPSFHFTYPGFSWVSPLPGIGMYIVFLVLGLCAALILLGLHYRKAVFVHVLTFLYIFLLDQTQYLNHFYLVLLINGLLLFVPAHRYVSLDARFGKVKMSSVVPAWSYIVLQAQIGIAYFYGGIAKINEDWLRGQPLTLWLEGRQDVPLLGAFYAHPSAGILLSYAGLLIDLLIVPLLLWKRTRIPAFTFALLFNLWNAMLFNIGIFPWFMMVATTLYLDPSWPRKLAAFFTQQTVESPSTDSGGIGKLKVESASVPKPKIALENQKLITNNQKLVVCTLITFFVLQFVIPFRHFLYQDSVHWTEEGHMFAWHMKLRSKDAYAYFTVVTDKGEEIPVENRDFLTARQEKKMSARPEMIRQFAHHLDEEFAAMGYGDVQVYVDATASLNGREFALLIDPDRDLSGVDFSLRKADWILPLE